MHVLTGGKALEGAWGEEGGPAHCLLGLRTLSGWEVPRSRAVPKVKYWVRMVVVLVTVSSSSR